MAKTLATSETLSAFCNGIAVMLAAGIQVDEAVAMLADDTADPSMSRVLLSVYDGLLEGKTLAGALEATGAFPAYAVSVIAIGERSGRLEAVLRSLAVYYDEEERMFAKIRANVGYPAALLCVMSLIVAFTVVAVLPTFQNVYANLGGSLTAGSFGQVEAAVVVGWASLALTLALTVVALAAVVMSHTVGGRQRLMRVLSWFPATRDSMYELGFSRFVSCLSIYVASGMNTDDAMHQSLGTVENPLLRKKCERAYNLMVDLRRPRSLTQAISETGLLQPVYARMLSVSSRSGSLDESLDDLSDLLFEEAAQGLDAAIDAVEPTLAVLVTVAVGATLIAVMLPLVGIMGSIA